MNIAEELAAKNMSVNIYIRANSVHITLIAADGGWAAKSRIRQGPADFDVIEAEIEKLLEGCNEHN